MKHCPIRRPTNCSSGEHSFLVSRWLITGATQQANGFTCSKCLLTVDGKLDIDAAKETIHAEQSLQATPGNNGQTARGKGSKSPSGEKQDSQGQT